MANHNTNCQQSEKRCNWGAPYRQKRAPRGSITSTSGDTIDWGQAHRYLVHRHGVGLEHNAALHAKGCHGDWPAGSSFVRPDAKATRACRAKDGQMWESRGKLLSAKSCDRGEEGQLGKGGNLMHAVPVVLRFHWQYEKKCCASCLQRLLPARSCGTKACTALVL